MIVCTAELERELEWTIGKLPVKWADRLARKDIVIVTSSDETKTTPYRTPDGKHRFVISVNLHQYADAGLGEIVLHEVCHVLFSNHKIHVTEKEEIEDELKIQRMVADLVKWRGSRSASIRLQIRNHHFWARLHGEE